MSLMGTSASCQRGVHNEISTLLIGTVLFRIRLTSMNLRWFVVEADRLGANALYCEVGEQKGFRSAHVPLRT